MNEQLIKFIELCLMDGVISDKERRVIFTKSEELGISKDECEIILEGMIQKHSKKNSSQPQKKKGFFGSIMDEVKKGVDEVKKNVDVDSITDKVNSFREEYEKKVKESRTKTSSIVQEEKPQSNTTSSEGIKDEEKVVGERLQNDSDNGEFILNQSKKFDNSFEMILYIRDSFRGGPNYYEIDSFRNLIQPKYFGKNIWNSTIREQLIDNERTPQGKQLPLGNVSNRGVIIKKELLFGIIDRDEGVLFFPPINMKFGKKETNIYDYPKITLINGKKELLRGNQSPLQREKIIHEISDFQIFQKGKSIDGGPSYTYITYNNQDLCFNFEYNDTNFRLGQGGFNYDTSHEFKLTFNSTLINKILSYIGTMFNNG